MSEDGDSQKSWTELAERITKEQNSAKLTDLVQELIKALDEQGERKKPQHPLKPDGEQGSENSK